MSEITFTDKTGKKYTAYIDWEQLQYEKDYLDWKTHLYWKYFNPAGSMKVIAPEDEFEEWKKRGKPEPALFDRA